MQTITDVPRTRGRGMKEVGTRIRALREKYKLRQDVFAGKVLISRSLLSELENGKRPPTGPLLVALECLFYANREWVLTGKGDMIGRTAPGRTAESVLQGIGWNGDVFELLKGFNRLSKEGRKKIMNLLRVFLVVEETGPWRGNYSPR
jgi:transcriptional regulator with XRE-family HTH domain